MRHTHRYLQNPISAAEPNNRMFAWPNQCSTGRVTEQGGEALNLPQKLTLNSIAYSITVHPADRRTGRQLLSWSHIGAL